MWFTKMHGVGNDYVYVSGFDQPVDFDPAEAARKLADRHFGVGGDGLILVLPPDAGDDADVVMRMFNADGSEAEMCGNGVRCVAKLAWDRGHARANPVRVKTGNGVLSLALELDSTEKVERVNVDMGEPKLDLADIPVKQGATARNAYFKKKGDHEYALSVPGHPATGTFVSMGNPHVVFFVDDLEAVDLHAAGPAVEHFGAFPERINAHWVRVVSETELKVVHWERGSGATLACGTGVCAVVVAAVLTGRAGRSIRCHVPGGELHVEWKPDNHVILTGPATEVFSGEIEL